MEEVAVAVHRPMAYKHIDIIRDAAVLLCELPLCGVKSQTVKLFDPWTTPESQTADNSIAILQIGYPVKRRESSRLYNCVMVPRYNDGRRAAVKPICEPCPQPLRCVVIRKNWSPPTA